MKLSEFSVAVFLTFVSLFLSKGCNSESEENTNESRYKIDGKVVVPFTADQEWIGNTRILVDGGDYLGFVR